MGPGSHPVLIPFAPPFEGPRVPAEGLRVPRSPAAAIKQPRTDPAPCGSCPVLSCPVLSCPVVGPAVSDIISNNPGPAAAGKINHDSNNPGPMWADCYNMQPARIQADPNGPQTKTSPDGSRRAYLIGFYLLCFSIFAAAATTTARPQNKQP